MAENLKGLDSWLHILLFKRGFSNNNSMTTSINKEAASRAGLCSFTQPPHPTPSTSTVQISLNYWQLSRKCAML
jgi:hypothetical protein